MNPLQQYVRSGGISAVTVLQALALVAPLAMAIIDRGIGTVQIAITSISVCVLWEILFASTRGQHWSFNGVTTGILVAILVSSETSLWQITIAASLGMVIGELIFGGRGFGFLNATVVSLAILMLSFPSTSLAPATAQVALATAPGLVLLYISGLVPWRVLLTCLGLVLAFALLEDATTDVGSILAGVVFGVTFLVADPFACCQSRTGQFLQGALAAVLIVVFNNGPTSISTQSLVQTALMCSLIAPLIDQISIVIKLKLRGRNYG